MPAILKRREISILGYERVVFSRLANGERCIPFLYIVARGPQNLPRDIWHTYLPFSLCLFISIYVLVRQIDKRGKDSVGPWERGCMLTRHVRVICAYLRMYARRR